MASSLLFKISTIFSGAGFRQAGEGLGRLLRLTTPLIAAIAKLGFRFGILQTIVGVVFGRALIRGIQGATGEAIKAETAFNRLSIQLNLLGQGSRQNIEQVTRFAREAAGATRFAARETEEAVTIALRRTGDVETALKQVAVAQDIAAATGRGLRRTTLLLNIAQAGNTRILKQITDLSNEQIRTAVRQGRLLDVLGEKFGGAASEEAGTLAGKIAILRNEQELLSSELGAIGLPISKFITDIGILGRRLTRFAVTEVKQVGGAVAGIASSFTFAGRAIAGTQQILGDIGRTAQEVSPFLRQLFSGGAQSAREAASSIKTSSAEINRELEINLLKAEGGRDAVRDINRLVARVQQNLLQAQNFGIRSLTQQQLLETRSLNFSAKQLLANEKLRIEAQQNANLERERATTTRRAQVAPGGEASLEARIRNQANIIQLLGRSETTFAASVEKINEEISSLARSEVEAGTLAQTASDRILGRVSALLDGATSIEQAIGRLRSFGTVFESITPAVQEAIVQFTPQFQPNITLSLSAEQIAAAIQSGARAGLAGVLAQLQSQVSANTAAVLAQQNLSGE